MKREARFDMFHCKFPFRACSDDTLGSLMFGWAVSCELCLLFQTIFSPPHPRTQTKNCLRQEISFISISRKKGVRFKKERRGGKRATVKFTATQDFGRLARTARGTNIRPLHTGATGRVDTPLCGVNTLVPDPSSGSTAKDKSLSHSCACEIGLLSKDLWYYFYKRTRWFLLIYYLRSKSKNIRKFYMISDHLNYLKFHFSSFSFKWREMVSVVHHIKFYPKKQKQNLLTHVVPKPCA